MTIKRKKYHECLTDYEENDVIYLFFKIVGKICCLNLVRHILYIHDY